MEFRLLGPLEILDSGRTVALGGPKQRTVLVSLLLRPNQVVAADRLIDDVWGEDAPPAARNVLQTYVSRLRQAISDDRLEGRAGGYVLHADPAELDSFRFEELVARARSVAGADPATAAEAYRTALGLWRGPALEDLGDQPSLQPEIARLEEMRVSAAEELVELELALGRHAELVSEIEALTARHPLRERLWGQLMLALYRSGRQGDALAAFHRARETLADELGIDPSPELVRLQEQILRQDAALDVAGRPLRGYRLLERIGHGAFGEVFRARQPHVAREVAVKVIHRHLANDPDFIRRFEAEAQLVARLEHPHVVPLYDYWREPGGAYLVMRFLRGGSLREALDAGPLPPDRVAMVAEHVAQALGSAHRHGIVHRDVKPANILFDEEDNAYLSDFGIAKDLATAQASTGGGTPSPFAYYVSPEEVRGQPPTARADIYSLGLVIYEMLAGHHPFADARPHELPEKHVRDRVPPVSGATRHAPAVDEVVARATAKDPADRYEDALALASALRAALGNGAATVAVTDVDVRNPYKGIEPFLEADAPDFFGRDAMVRRLVARLRRQPDGSRLLVVAGPSGSGKSSLVRAGLIPAVRTGAVPGSNRWFVVQMVPAERPFAELARALLEVASEAASTQLMDDIASDDEGLVRAVDRLLPADGSELLLVIDQLEELFTLVDREDVRARFVATLVTAATHPRSRVRIVVTIRADFYDRPLLYGDLAELVREGTEVVVPLDPEELEQAIVRPASRVGVRIAPGLIAQLVADVAGQPGSLPLLQYALTELFEIRNDSTVELDAYRKIGGVAGALARSAEESYRSLSEPGREAARQLFLRLVTVSDEAEDTRRRLLRADLISLHADAAPAEAALDAFGRARLLSFDRDPETRAPTVEVAHEALLREWQRLRGWIDAARDDLRTQRRLAVAAREWRDSGRDRSFLASGSRLERFEAITRGSTVAVSPDERDFVEASVAERERRRADEEARLARERSLERRSLRRLRGLVAVLAVAAIVATTLTYIAVRERGRAEREAAISAARELAAAAVANLDEDPELSILLALEAVDRSRSVDGSVLPQAEEALHRAVVGSRIVRRVPGLGGGLDWSPRGDMFATEGPEDSGLVDIRDARTGESLRSFRGHEADVNLVAFSEDGSMLATTGDDGTVRVWDPATGEELRRLRGPDPAGQAWGPSFSPDGSILAATWPDEGVVRVWDLSTGEQLHELGPWEVNFVTSFSPDGRRLAIATWDAGGVVVDVASGKEVFALEGQGGVRDVDWSPDGRWIATSSSDSTVRLWNARTGDHGFTVFAHRGEVVAGDWSPDSTHLATGGSDGTVKVWEVTAQATREVVAIPAQDAGGGVWPAFSADGQRVMTGDNQITAVKIWDVGRTGDEEWTNVPVDPSDLGGVAFTADGRHVVGSNGDGSVTLWDAETGKGAQTIGPPTAADETPLAVIAIAPSPDGGLIATSGPVATVWDAETGEEAFTVSAGEGVEDLAWSPDGRFLAAVGAGGAATVVDRSGARVASLPHDEGLGLSAVSFSHDGRLLATAGIPMRLTVPGAETVTVWDWEAGRAVKTIGAYAEAVAFDPLRDRIATAAVFGVGEIWDVETGRKIATLTGHTGPVNDIAFAPDGRVIATGSADGTVRLWDARSGSLRLVLQGHEAAVWDLAFSRDGSKLVSASPEGTARVWALDVDDLVEIARSELTRSLTDEECRQYLHVDQCPQT